MTYHGGYWHFLYLDNFQRSHFFLKISPANFPTTTWQTARPLHHSKTRDPLKETPRLHCRKSPCCYGRSQTLDDCHGCSASLFSHSTAPRLFFIWFDLFFTGYFLFRQDMDIFVVCMSTFRDAHSVSKQESETLGLCLNITKTKLMMIGGEENKDPLLVDGKEMEKVAQFNFLGAIISANKGGCRWENPQMSGNDKVGSN